MAWYIQAEIKFYKNSDSKMKSGKILNTKQKIKDFKIQSDK